MKDTEIELYSTICTLTGTGLNSPQVGVQRLVMFLSKKKPSAQSEEFSPNPGRVVISVSGGGLGVE